MYKTKPKKLSEKKNSIIHKISNKNMDYQDTKIAKKRLNDKSDKVISADEMFKELGL